MTNPISLHSSFQEQLEAFINNCPVDRKTQLLNFPKYTDRQHIAKFLAKYEIFKLIQDVPGDILECGVLNGGGLMSWANFSAILEPYNYMRRVIGFDTFTGFPAGSISENDFVEADLRSVDRIEPGKNKASAGPEEMLEAIRLFDSNRPIGHVRKVELIVGAAEETIPKFLSANPQLVVALLNLDFNLYSPTRSALNHFFHKIPKGGIIVIDDLGSQRWPGESRAVEDMLGIRSLRLKRIPFEPVVAYSVIE